MIATPFSGPFSGIVKEKAIAAAGSIAINLALMVAIVSMSDFGQNLMAKGASLVVVNLGGAAAESKAAPLPAAPPPPAAEPPPTPDISRPKDRPDAPKIALLQRPEPVAKPASTATDQGQKQDEDRSSAEQERLAAEQQRRAEEAAKARAEEQARQRAQSEAQAKAQAAAQAKAQAQAEAAANNQSSAASGARAKGGGGYKAAIWQHLQRFRRPNSVGAGSTLVRFTVNDSGGVLNVAVARSSGSSAFDREAMQMVRRAAPFPKPPQGAGRVFEFEIKGQ